MNNEVVDLRTRRKGCTGDPVFRLNKVLSKGDPELILLTDPAKLPLEVVSLLAKRKGYSVVKHEQNEGHLKIFLKKST